MQNDLANEIRAYAQGIAPDATDRAFNPRDLQRAFRNTSHPSVGEVLRALAELFDDGELTLNANGEFEAKTDA